MIAGVALICMELDALGCGVVIGPPPELGA
jgi:hypothetical protein